MEGMNTRILVLITIIFLLIFNNFEISVCENNFNITVVIIGAGPSGIAAAAKLLENGFNVTILEAENRIGGRVHTTSLGNYSVDMGGQWVHGQGDNVAYQLAHPIGLLDETDRHDFGIEEEYTDSSGKRLSANFEKELRDFLQKYALDATFDNDTIYESLGEYVEKMFDEVFKDKPEVINDRRKYLLYMESLTVTSESAETWHDISTSNGNEYTVYPGDQIVNWKERGYSTILDILMKRYPDTKKEIPVLNNTILNTQVTLINYTNNVESPSILITTTEGKLYKADHVIMTVSLGVLKANHESLFSPPLPSYKINTIQGLGFGAVAKIYLLFEKPFWHLGNGRILVFSFLWNEVDRKVIEIDPERSWLIGMYGAITVEHKPNLLTLWMGGKQVKAMEALSEDIVFKYAVENLHRFLDKQYNITEPVAMLRTRWYSNPHFMGTYSYRSLETHKRRVYPEMLERPIDEKNLRVLFAGEATSSKRFSTVDGAISSGWKAADRLINHYKN